MPSIFDVAVHFNDIVLTDAYGGPGTWYGQLASFIGASPDGSTTTKKVLSLAPGTGLPTRKCIAALSEQWIVGMNNVDGIYGTPIRVSYWMKKVNGSYTFSSRESCTWG